MSEQTAPQDIRLVTDAAAEAQCSERYVWHLLGRGDLTRYKAAGRTYVDVPRLRDLLVPRPV